MILFLFLHIIRPNKKNKNKKAKNFITKNLEKEGNIDESLYLLTTVAIER